MPISTRSYGRLRHARAKTLSIEDGYDMPARVAVRLRSLVRPKGRLPHAQHARDALITSKVDVIGVLQLINKKREPKQKLLTPEDFEARRDSVRSSAASSS